MPCGDGRRRSIQAWVVTTSETGTSISSARGRRARRAEVHAHDTAAVERLPVNLLPFRPEISLVAGDDVGTVARFYESILGGIADGIIVQDRSGNPVYANDAAAREVGFSSVGNLLSSPLQDLRDQIQLSDEDGNPADLEDLPGFALLRGKDVGERVFQLHFPLTGKTVWTAVSSAPVLDESGEVVFVVSTFRSVTERKAAEEERARFAAIFQYSNDAIITKTLDGLIATWNPAAERLFGYTVVEAVGKPITILVRLDRDDERARLLDAVRSGERIEHHETEWVGRDGKRIDLSVSVSPIQDASGRITGAATIGRDVGDRKRLEAQFHHAQKLEAVGRLAGGVAHDFNNLLTVISGFSEILLMQLARGDPRRGMVEEIARAGMRATGLTRQLLVFSRRQVVRPREMNLNEVVSEAEKMLRRLIGENIDLVSILHPDLGRVKADPGQIEQVIVNLVVNARDAMPQGGKLTIETANVDLDDSYARDHVQVIPGPHVVLAVTDTGTGMGPDTRAHIFEPFFTTKPPDRGTGLGLSTVHGIVTKCGGHVWVYSEQGRGTTFKVYLPRVDAKISLDPAPLELPAPVGGSETVLLVEDDDVVRLLVRQVLASYGYEVLETRSGEEAHIVAGNHGGPIQLLLTDVVLPGLGGRAVAERLTALRPALKVLFLSGYGENAVVRHGVLHAGAALLEKPFIPSVLARMVREVLDGPERA